MDASAHDIIAECCLSDANSPAAWGLQRDLIDALRDHADLTVEQVHEALAGVLHSFSLSWNEIRYTDRDQCEGGLNGAG